MTGKLVQVTTVLLWCTIWPSSAILDLLGKSWNHPRRPNCGGYPA